MIQRIKFSHEILVILLDSSFYLSTVDINKPSALSVNHKIKGINLGLNALNSFRKN